jgi:hypothetical protein
MALSNALPGQFDPKEAMRLKLELDALIAAVQRAREATDTEYFDWLEANIPQLFSNRGRPNWIESEKVREQDEALLKEFEDALARNVAATGKTHRASQKTYSDLADKYGYEDEETVKQKVMRGRRRQKALNETIQDISHIAAKRETDSDKVITPQEYSTRREKLLETLRRLLRTK